MGCEASPWKWKAVHGAFCLTSCSPLLPDSGISEGEMCIFGYRNADVTAVTRQTENLKTWTENLKTPRDPGTPVSNIPARQRGSPGQAVCCKAQVL